MGIMHDDYDYRLVNLILKQSLKAFIKKVMNTLLCWIVSHFDRLRVNQKRFPGMTMKEWDLHCDQKKRFKLCY